MRNALLPFLLLLFGFFPSHATAQESASQAVFLDPSIQDAGMGGAGASIFWRDEPNEWANPSLAGLYQGIRYSYGKTQLVPDLADDVFFKTHRIHVGGWGVGIAMAGK